MMGTEFRLAAVDVLDAVREERPEVGEPTAAAVKIILAEHTRDLLLPR